MYYVASYLREDYCWFDKFEIAIEAKIQLEMSTIEK